MERNNFLRTKNIFSAGFTVVEFLVVAGVMALILVMVLADYRSGEKQYLLETTSRKIMADIRRAQTMAVSSAELVNKIPDSYGVYFNVSSNTYIIFADQDNNKEYNSGEEVEIISLPQRIEFDSLNPPSYFSVVFIPPDPKTEITPDPGLEPARVVLRVQDSDRTRAVLVSKAGVIEME